MTKLQSRLITVLIVAGTLCLALIADAALHVQWLADDLRANAAGNLNNGLYNADALLYQVRQDESAAAARIIGTTSRPGILTETEKAIAAVKDVVVAGNSEQRDYYRAIKPKTLDVLDDMKRLNAPRIGEDVHRTFAELNGDPQNPGLIQSAQDVLIALRDTTIDVDERLVRDPDIQKSLANIAGITSELQLTTADLQRVANKYANQLTAPMSKKEKALAALDFILRGLQLDYEIRLLNFKH